MLKFKIEQKFTVSAVEILNFDLSKCGKISFQPTYQQTLSIFETSLLKFLHFHILWFSQPKNWTSKMEICGPLKTEFETPKNVSELPHH